MRPDGDRFDPPVSARRPERRKSESESLEITGARERQRNFLHEKFRILEAVVLNTRSTLPQVEEAKKKFSDAITASRAELDGFVKNYLKSEGLL